MQCPECSYISFKIEKSCGACGFKFKKNQQGSSLAGKESFSIFAGPAMKEQEKTETSADNVGVLESQEPESFIDVETGDFKLNLPDIEEDDESSDSEDSEYEPLEFDPNADIDLGEVEVEGLGLEPFLTEEDPKTEEPALEIAEPEEESILSLDEPALEIAEPEEESILSLDEPALEIAEPEEESILSLDEPALEIAEPEEESILSLDEPALEIAEPEEESILSLDEPALEIAEPEEEPILSIDEPALEIAEPEEEPILSIDEPALEITEPENEMEELDLGDGEIKLDLGYEPPPTNEPDPAALAAQLDSLDLNLEIDDSDGPLETSNHEAPEIEIEDLGLELESPEDDLDKDKS